MYKWSLCWCQFNLTDDKSSCLLAEIPFCVNEAQTHHKVMVLNLLASDSSLPDLSQILEA